MIDYAYSDESEVVGRNAHRILLDLANNPYRVADSFPYGALERDGEAAIHRIIGFLLCVGQHDLDRAANGLWSFLQCLKALVEMASNAELCISGTHPEHGEDRLSAALSLSFSIFPESPDAEGTPAEGRTGIVRLDVQSTTWSIEDGHE